jgi:hypothetical protein
MLRPARAKPARNKCRKTKNPLELCCASGPVSALLLRSMQSSAGAAFGRDDDGDDAPQSACQEDRENREKCQWRISEAPEKSRSFLQKALEAQQPWLSSE